MLGPVVLEHPVDLLHPGDGGHVGQEDGDLEHRLQHHLGPAAQRHQMVQAAHQHRGQNGEEQDGKQPADHGSRRQHDIFGLFAQMVTHPFFKGGLLFGGVVVIPHAHLCRVHHVLVSHDQAFDHRDGSPHQRDLCPHAVGGGGLDLGLNGSIGLADGTADVFRAPHHNALHQGLPAHTRLEAFLVRLIHWLSYGATAAPLYRKNCPSILPDKYGQSLIVCKSAGPG